MHFPMAFCPSHGIFQAVGTVAMENCVGVTITGCETQCPRCGRRAEIVPGEYSTVGPKLNLIVDPSISPEALSALRDIVIRLQKDEITPEEAKASAEKLSPKLGGLFDIANWDGQAKATLYAAIIGATALLASAKISSNEAPTINIQPVVERVIERRTEMLKYSISSIPVPTPRPKK